ncbi:hypothetical protein ECE50_000725 [Chitinophaga sp. Mgbs1]|uniref:Uncharacterized protein n=1 Tax=Chitinophaga solisilvae TaxID=1233460 RepID=A0A3S1AUR0_9BACT|nr:hypothetical protein [Chitinophaga solisilvae]
MKNIIILVGLLQGIISYGTAKITQSEYDVHTDVRLGQRFYSIFLHKDGFGYVVKGIGSYYTEPLRIDSSVSSNIFRVDSIKGLIHILSKLNIDSTIKRPMGTIPRVEIYYKNKKVYDAYRWDQSVWNGLRPIISQLPHGFNPFLVNDNPFE